MDFTSKKASLVISAITALLFSRAMFLFFNDPEGTNLLVSAVMALVVYFLSLLAGRLFFPSAVGSKKLGLTIVTQIIIVAALWFFLK